MKPLLISQPEGGRVVVALSEPLQCKACKRAALIFVNSGGRSVCSACEGES